MSEKTSAYTEKEAAMSEVTADDVRDEMSALVKEAAEPARVGESVKAAIRRAARRLNMRYGRVKRHWYGEARQVSADEYLNAQQKIEHRRKQRAAELRSELDILERDYARRHAEFLQSAHPALARLAPPAPAASKDQAGRRKGKGRD